MSPAPDKTEAEKAEDVIMDRYLRDSFRIPPTSPKEPDTDDPDDEAMDAYFARSFPGHT